MPQTPVDNPEGTPGLFRFSTHALPAHERVPVFCEVLGRKLLRVQAEPLPRFEFNAEMQIRSLPGLTFVAERHSPFRIGRTKELLSDSDDSIVVQSFSTGAVERRGRRYHCPRALHGICARNPARTPCAPAPGCRSVLRAASAGRLPGLATSEDLSQLAERQPRTARPGI